MARLDRRAIIQWYNVFSGGAARKLALGPLFVYDFDPEQIFSLVCRDSYNPALLKYPCGVSI
jgi:hypothetical protein